MLTCTGLTRTTHRGWPPKSRVRGETTRGGGTSGGGAAGGAGGGGGGARLDLASFEPPPDATPPLPPAEAAPGGEDRPPPPLREEGGRGAGWVAEGAVVDAPLAAGAAAVAVGVRGGGGGGGTNRSPPCAAAPTLGNAGATQSTQHVTSATTSVATPPQLVERRWRCGPAMAADDGADSGTITTKSECRSEGEVRSPGHRTVAQHVDSMVSAAHVNATLCRECQTVGGWKKVGQRAEEVAADAGLTADWDMQS